jgi:hypothetical protein
MRPSPAVSQARSDVVPQSIARIRSTSALYRSHGNGGKPATVGKSMRYADREDVPLYRQRERRRLSGTSLAAWFIVGVVLGAAGGLFL